MTKIFVTGSNGQLGNEIKDLSKKFDYTFLFHDIDTLDLTNFDLLEEFFDRENPQFVINCAGYTAVDKAEEEKEKAFLVNATVPYQLAVLSKKYNSRLFHISTDYVFDGKSYIPYTEEDPANPSSVYGKSKLEGEKKVLDECEPVIIRTSWLYSKHGNNFVKTVLRLAEQREHLNMIFDQTGTPTCAADLASAILKIIHFSEKDKFIPGIYHYSNEGVCSWFDFAHSIIELSGLKTKVFPINTYEYPLPAPRPAYSVLNKSKIKKIYGIEVPYWRDSLKKTINELVK